MTDQYLPTRRFAPRPHQQDAITAGTRHLRTRGSRALITAACGTGKTLTSIRIAESLGARLILNAAPTLDLLAQTALAWRADHRREPMVIMSSMDTEAHEGLQAARIGGTNDASDLARALTTLPKLTVFTTYASLDKIEATQYQGFDVPPFDLAIMDEAHRISGRAEKTWAIVHDATRIRADRRLYLTATPRIWDSPDITEVPDPRRRRTPTANPRVTPAHSMDDPAIFGRHVHSYDLATAIADDVLADYQILIPTITDDELRTQLTLKTTTPQARATTALHLAITKAITQHQLTHVLVYFNEVEAATNFTREYHHTLRNLPLEVRPPTTPHVAAIHGEHTPEERQKILQDFTHAETAILTNAKLLAEGIDITGIDAVVFADTTRSVVRCVQALGRALRKPAGTGKVSSLIIPAYVPPGADPTDLLGSAYEPVWAIAAALRSHDHRIMERLPNRAHRLPGETSRLIASRWRFDFDTDPEAIARAMDLIAFDPRGPLTRARRQGLSSLQAFHDTFGHLAVPGEYVDAYGFATGAFVHGQRDAYRRGELANDPEWVAELEALGMIWNTHDAARQAHLATIRAYHDLHGHLAIPTIEPGGGFLAEQRSLAARGRLDADHHHELDAIDPDWQLPHGADWTRKYHALRSYVRAGNDPATIREDTVIGSLKAGVWLKRQLADWNKLTLEQRNLLTQSQLTPEASQIKTRPQHKKRSFHETADLVTLFLEREDRLPSAREWITLGDERIMIGRWLAKTRAKHREGQLPQSASELLDRQLGPEWAAIEAPEGE